MIINYVLDRYRVLYVGQGKVKKISPKILILGYKGVQITFLLVIRTRWKYLEKISPKILILGKKGGPNHFPSCDSDKEDNLEYFSPKILILG